MNPSNNDYWVTLAEFNSHHAVIPAISAGSTSGASSVDDFDGFGGSLTFSNFFHW